VLYLKYFLVFLLALSQELKSQKDIGQFYPEIKKFDFIAVYDSTYGIMVYNNLIATIGGDSVRFDQRGNNAQGWIEDFYLSGKILHKGYYVDGQLRVFKNFYENGTLERAFKLEDAIKSIMTIYFLSGKVHSEVVYFGETITRQIDYFENGQKENEEENDKSGLILLNRIEWFENGIIENSLNIVDKKKKKYLSRENFSNGKKKNEGEIKLNIKTHDFEKDGIWNTYNEEGFVTKTEKYQNGKIHE
jgi:antitoxin component YwqK of YwqJK toxin-antitoxin module